VCNVEMSESCSLLCGILWPGFGNSVLCSSPKPYGSSITLQFNVAHCKASILYTYVF
jgi:hypothetical protein